MEGARGRRNRYGKAEDEGAGKRPAPGRMTRTMRLDQQSAPSMDDVATAVVESKGGGAPVPDGVRRIAESHLGADLSGVRVHSDDDARSGAAAVGALAFTHGRDVFLGPGQSGDDVGLMTHELTHVVQQGAAGAVGVQRKVEVQPGDHPAEAEAEAVAGRAVAQGEAAPGAVVEDGVPAKPGQMAKNAVLSAVHAAVESELSAAPPTVADSVRRDLGARIESLRGRDARGVEQGLASVTGVQGARDAQAYVGAARVKVREQVAALPPTTVAGATAQMGPGAPVDAGVASAASAATGQPFGDVQVHTGEAAARMTADHGARAIAVGNHIAFAPGAYQPGTLGGDALLGHELAHVAQMRGAPEGAAIERADDGEHEAAADEVAVDIVVERHGPAEGKAQNTSGSQPSWASRLSSKLSLRRCPDDPQAAARARQQAAAAAQQAALQAQAVAVTAELTTLVRDASWEAMRARLYPQISAPAVQAARDRRAPGGPPDLTGLGAISSLDSFASAVHGIQTNWGSLGNQDARADALLAAANAALRSAHVPEFTNREVRAMNARGQFSHGGWLLVFQQQMLANPTLSDDAAADLCNVTLHESRHAEQAFLAARWAAGQRQTVAQIASNLDMPPAIARLAAARPITARSGNPAERALAERMFDAEVTHGAANNQLERDADAAITELKARHLRAQAALSALQGGATAQTLAAAQQARDDLRAQVPIVETAYRAYRAIPFEADAHEVGDSAEVAFRRPP